MNNATGLDLIPNILLKICARRLAHAMRPISKLSIDTGKSPKGLNKCKCISCLWVMSICYKTTAQCLLQTTETHIIDHLEKDTILTSLNHGFRSGYSSETQLVTTIHDLLGKYDVGTQLLRYGYTCTRLLQGLKYSPHGRLLRKMKQYGLVADPEGDKLQGSPRPRF